MAKVTTRKKKRTTDRTGCVTTRCCVECPRPSRRRRRRQVASKSLPLSRAMPMPLPSLQNIMPSPFMPLNIPLPRVEQNRRPPGTYQKNNQPIRVQQKSTRSLATMTDNMVRGVTSQRAPITNAPVSVPQPTLVQPRLPVGPPPGRELIRNRSEASLATPRMETPRMKTPRVKTPDNPFWPLPPPVLPNILDLKGMNALGVGNQGQNLRESPLVEVTRNELLSRGRGMSFSSNESFPDFGSVDESSEGSLPLSRGSTKAIRRTFPNQGDSPRKNIEQYIEQTYPTALKTLNSLSGAEIMDLADEVDERVERQGGFKSRIATDTSTEISI